MKNGFETMTKGFEQFSSFGKGGFEAYVQAATVFAKTFERVNGVRVPFVMKDRRAGDVASCFADPSLALQRLGWKTERSVDDMCRDAWRWQQFAVAQGL